MESSLASAARYSGARTKLAMMTTRDGASMAARRRRPADEKHRRAKYHQLRMLFRERGRLEILEMRGWGRLQNIVRPPTPQKTRRYVRYSYILRFQHILCSLFCKQDTKIDYLRNFSILYVVPSHQPLPIKSNGGRIYKDILPACEQQQQPRRLSVQSRKQ